MCGEVVRYHEANFVLKKGKYSCFLEKIDK